jgi:hypothetical protein
VPSANTAPIKRSPESFVFTFAVLQAKHKNVQNYPVLLFDNCRTFIEAQFSARQLANNSAV